LCSKAEFLHTPLEQQRVSKESGNCDNLIYTHFQTKPVFHFTFKSQNAQLVRLFMDKLDTYAQEFDLEESKDFLSYPITHDFKHKALIELGNSCPCDPFKTRNQYLNN
jgi:hypothetical protein